MARWVLFFQVREALPFIPCPFDIGLQVCVGKSVRSDRTLYLFPPFAFAGCFGQFRFMFEAEGFREKVMIMNTKSQALIHLSQGTLFLMSVII